MRKIQLLNRRKIAIDGSNFITSNNKSNNYILNQIIFHTEFVEK
jgi:hypothetical protein